MTAQRTARSRALPGARPTWMPGLAAELILSAGHEPASTGWPLSSHLELKAVSAAVPVARRHAAKVLQQWHMQALVDNVELLVSELITNAICASARVTGQQGETGPRTGTVPVQMRLTSDLHVVTIQVWDPDPRRPGTQDAGPYAETGRGLLLVEALSARWGCHTADGRTGKIVWAVCAPQDPPLSSA